MNSNVGFRIVFSEIFPNSALPLMLKFIYSEKATKCCEIFTLLLTVCTVVKSKVKISKNFVAFSEYMNFDKIDAWKDWNLKLKPFRRFCCLSYWTSHCTSKVHNHLTM